MPLRHLPLILYCEARSDEAIATGLVVLLEDCFVLRTMTLIKRAPRQALIRRPLRYFWIETSSQNKDKLTSP